MQEDPKQNDLGYLRAQENYCKAMAEVCRRRGEFRLQKFYENARIGYRNKFNAVVESLR